MRVVFDTNSLLSLVRYYLPFDEKEVLFQFIKLKIENGEIIIDKILDKCNYISKGVVLNKMPFLVDKVFSKKARIPYKTEDLLIPNTRHFFIN